MADSFGATFAPIPDPSGKNASVAPVQQAIQLLSMRIPKMTGAASPAPAALLNSPGSAGRPDVHSAVLQTILKTIMGQGMPMANTPVPAALTAPAPLGGSSTPSPITADVAPPDVRASSAAPSPFSAPQRDAPIAPPTGPKVSAHFGFSNGDESTPPPPDVQPYGNDGRGIPVDQPMSIDALKQTAGFRQHDPGVYTNDASFAQGFGFAPDASPQGYKQVRLG